MSSAKTDIPVWLFALLAVLALAAAGCPVTQSQDTPVSHLKRTEPVTGTGYYLYVPSNYGEHRAWPLVVTLQGTYGFDDARRQIKEWKALAEDKGFIVVAPNMKSTQGVLPVLNPLRRRDLATDEKAVLAVMDELKRQYRIDETAVMITGYSAGGFPMYYTALRNPQRFSVLVSRMANCDMRFVRDIPITDEARKLHFLIFFSKRGITPASSNLNPVGRESWAIFRHLRQSRCYNAKIKKMAGGHRRMPEPAYEFWAQVQPHIVVPTPEED